MDITYGPLLGTGPFGTDYLGMNTITGEFVAIREVQGLEECKLEDLTSSLDGLKAKSLQHANLITHLGYEPGDSSVIIFSEYVIGHGAISSYVQQHGSFDDSIIRSFTRQIILELEYLQSEGVATI
jgi:serine/threonine protein kinase